MLHRCILLLSVGYLVLGPAQAWATPLEEEYIGKPGWCPALAGPAIQDEHHQWHLSFGPGNGLEFVEFHSEFLAQSDDFRLYGFDSPPGDVDPDPAAVPVTPQPGATLVFGHTNLNGFVRPAGQDVALLPGTPTAWPARPANLRLGNLAFHLYNAAGVGNALDSLFHGNIHIAIATHDRVGAVLGDMGNTHDATRDGAFFHVHKHINNIYADWAVGQYRLVGNTGLPIFLSVSSDASGAAGSALNRRRQSNVYQGNNPATANQYGAIPRIGSDIYVANNNNSNLVYQAGVRQWSTLNGWDLDAFTTLNQSIAGWYFSVTMASAGVAGTAVAAEAVRGGDIFESAATGTNALFRPESGLGLIATTSDELDALEVDQSRQIQATNDAKLPGIYDRPKQWFSLRAGTTFGVQATGGGAVGPQDILTVDGSGRLQVAVPGGVLGLGAGDDLDALAIMDSDGSNSLTAADRIYYSLRAGSAALAGNSAADIFCHTVAGVPCGALGGRLHVTAAMLGLRPADDLDALDIRTAPTGRGACCARQGCQEIGAQQCAAIGGLYEGDETKCQGVECPSTPGACCLPVGGCEVLSDQECLQASGSFLGSGAACPANGCPVPPTYDDCGHAYTIPYDYPRDGYKPPADNYYATESGSDPAYSCADHNVFFPAYGSNTLWYRYDQPVGVPVKPLSVSTADTAQFYPNGGGAGDTRVAIYYAPQGDCSQLQEVACGDNTYGPGSKYDQYGSAYYPTPRPGGTYYIQVSTAGRAAAGRIELKITSPAATTTAVPTSDHRSLSLLAAVLAALAAWMLLRTRSCARSRAD